MIKMVEKCYNCNEPMSDEEQGIMNLVICCKCSGIDIKTIELQEIEDQKSRINYCPRCRQGCIHQVEGFPNWYKCMACKLSIIMRPQN